MSTVDDIAASRHISLTTFRRDGTPVATPVWLVADGTALFVVTEAASGKVKRIRNNSEVVVTVCDVRGRILPNAPSARGTAQLLDEAATETGRALIARRYLLSRLGNGFARLLHLRRAPLIGIAITF